MEESNPNRHIYLLPNLLTTAGMFAGFYAILAAANGQFNHACLAIVAAAVFDGLDGRVARMTGTTSAFGVQYDSLSDLVSFGMAPALVMYHWSLVAMKADGVAVGRIGWAAAFLYMACAALRLARFNVQSGSSDKRWFIGLASPAAAGAMIGFVWFFNDLEVEGRSVRYLAVAVSVACGLLMVSRLRYFSFKAWPIGERVPFWAMIALVGVFVAFVVDTPTVLFVLATTYLLSGPVMWLWQKYQHQLRNKKAA